MLGFASLHILANNYQPLKWALALHGVDMESVEGKKLTRGSTFIAGGVCAGLAKYYGLNKGGVQAAFVILSLFLGFPILIYLALWLILPKES